MLDTNTKYLIFYSGEVYSSYTNSIFNHTKRRNNERKY
jgi:hypothetical protein